LKTVVIELPIENVSEADVAEPLGESSYVFDHLQHYLSLFDPLPAIHIQLGETGAILSRGRTYLEIARRLGRHKIRAIVDAPDSEALQKFLEQDGVEEVAWEREERNRHASGARLDWHVFYFARGLEPEEVKHFRDLLAGFFERLWAARNDSAAPELIVAQLHVDKPTALGEFQAWAPNDESWFASWRDSCVAFSHDVLEIVSYQGRRFVPQV
jgi:hypothetical protein